MKALGSDEDIEYTVALAEGKADVACFSIPVMLTSQETILKRLALTITT